MTITSVININIIVDLPSVNNIKVDLLSVNKKKTTKFWQKFKYYEVQHSTHTFKGGCLGKYNIFPYTRRSHVRWTGKSLCSH